MGILINMIFSVFEMVLLRHLVRVIFNCWQFSASVKLLDFSHVTRVLDSIGAEC